MKQVIIIGVLGCATVFSLGMASRDRAAAEEPEVVADEASPAENAEIGNEPIEEPTPMLCSDLAKFGTYDCPDAGNNETWAYTSPDCILAGCAEYSAQQASSLCNAACTAACTNSGWIYPCM